MITLWKFNDVLSLSYKIDSVSIVFLIAIVVLFACPGVYSIYYMKEKENLRRYYIVYMLLFFVLCAMSCAGNLFTFYLNYELMTLTSAPLVMHEQTIEARLAGFKYLIYSLMGAYCVLFGFYTLNKYCVSLDFTYGGTLNMAAVSDHKGLVLTAVFLMILGFGVKAGMWPFHSWLTSAHPIAVSPASAVLSGVIVKAGAVGIIRVVFYLAGKDFIEGTWVKMAWMVLILLTILMGSTLAFFEPVLKKRLAYSTISQVSYILFGLVTMTDVAYKGAMLQFIAHAFAKCALFLMAGLMIKISGSVYVKDLKGIGRKYPLLLWCFTICSLSMIGIPPTGGFIAKWYLIEGSLNSNYYNFPWSGPMFLLLSALLTAGYLLPIVLRGFFPGEEFEYNNIEKIKIPAYVYVSIIVLTALAVFVGICPGIFVGGGM